MKRALFIAALLALTTAGLGAFLLPPFLEQREQEARIQSLIDRGAAFRGHPGMQHAGSLHYANIAIIDLCRLNTLLPADVMVVSKCSNVAELCLRGTSVDDSSVSHLQSLVKLRKLSLFDTAITATGLAQLRSLPINSVTLSGAGFGDPEIYEVGRWNELEKLALLRCECSLESASFVGLKELRIYSCEGVTDDGLRKAIDSNTVTGLHLADLKCSVENIFDSRNTVQLNTLEIEKCPLSNDSIQDAVSAKSLEKLSLHSVGVDIKACDIIANSTSIRDLSLSGEDIDDACIERLCAMKQLNSLDLVYTGISDMSVQYLAKLQSLTQLRIGSAISAGAIEELKSALPKCKIQVVATE